MLKTGESATVIIAHTGVTSAAALKDWRTYADMRLRYRIALTAFMVNYLAAFAWDIIAGQPPMWMTVIPTLGFILTVSYVGYLGIKRAVSAKRCLSVR